MELSTRVEEIMAVRAQVEAEQIVAQKAVDQFFLPGEGAEGFLVGPGDVPELGDDEIVAGLLEHARQQAEVVVLNEHEGRFAVRLFDDRPREQFIDLAIRSANGSD